MEDQKRFEQLQADFDALKLNYDDAMQLNGELSSEIEKLSKAPAEVAKTEAKEIDIKSLSFKAGEDEFGFKYARTVLNGNAITALDILASADLQQKLISRNSGMIFKKGA